MTIYLMFSLFHTKQEFIKQYGHWQFMTRPELLTDSSMSISAYMTTTVSFLKQVFILYQYRPQILLERVIEDHKMGSNH